MFQSTKTYGHNLGFSCAFRQWRADSHCNYLHGYSLAFKFIFACDSLDARNWCVDFGGMKKLKSLLEDTFDHKTIVAEDDPEIEWFREGHRRGTLDLVELASSGCESFAQLVYRLASNWLISEGYGERVNVTSVEVFEHGANSAIYSE